MAAPTHASEGPDGTSRSTVLAGLTRRDAGLVLVAAVLVALVAGVVSLLIPAKYDATSVVRIDAAGGSANTSLAQTVQASNDLASQYAQLVNNSPGGASGTPVPGQASVSAAVIGNQNLVSLTSQASSAADAVSAVKTATESLVETVQTQQERAEEQAAKNLETLTGSIDDSIAAAQKKADQLQRSAQAADAAPGSAALLALSNQNDQINSLLAQRTTLQSQAAATQSGLGVSLDVVREGDSASRAGTSIWVNVLLGAIAGGLVMLLFVVRRSASRTA